MPLLEYVTLPRTGALEAILNVLGPHAGSVDLSLVEDMAGQLNGGETHNFCHVVQTNSFLSRGFQKCNQGLGGRG